MGNLTHEYLTVDTGSERHTEYKYDQLNRQYAITTAVGTTAAATTRTSYDKVGNILGTSDAHRLTSTTKNGQTQTYDYDSTDQVKTVMGSNSEAYTYDSNGNRTSGGYITDAGNRLRADGTYSYTYDAEGNRTSRTKIADGTVDTYSWDYRNRLRGIVTKDLDGVVTRTVGYTYDVIDRVAQLNIAKLSTDEKPHPRKIAIHNPLQTSENSQANRSISSRFLVDRLFLPLLGNKVLSSQL